MGNDLNSATATFTRDFWRTKSHIQTAVIGAAGWQAHIVDPETAAGPQNFLYMFDLPTKFAWMASMSRKLFLQVSNNAGSNQCKLQDVRDGLQAVIVEMSTGKTLPPIEALSGDQQAGLALAAYAGTTNTWEQADRMANGGHFIVLNYRRSINETNGLLRPVHLADTGNSILPARDFFSIIGRVIETDQVNHPEWFV